MDTNYANNMQKTYDALNGEKINEIGSPVVKAYEKLKNNSIKLYTDENGVLRAMTTNPGVRASVVEYLENRSLVKPAKEMGAGQTITAEIIC